MRQRQPPNLAADTWPWNDQPSNTPWVVSYVVEFDPQSIPELPFSGAIAGASVLGWAVARREGAGTRKTAHA